MLIVIKLFTSSFNLSELLVLGDGTVNFKEFMMMINKELEMQDNEQELIEAFKVFDREGNGFINSREVRRVMTNYGYKLTDAEVDHMVREADFYGDGQLNYEGAVYSLFPFGKCNVP